MTPAPSITLVTPSFNQAQFLEATIDSVLSQGYPRLQYVIMDGGSSDGSVEIIRRYSQYLHYWQTAPDRGQGPAVLDGWKHGDGELLGWLNSDDLLLKGALAAVGAAYDRAHHVYYGDLLAIDAAGVAYHYAALARPPDWVLRNGLLFTGQPGNFYSRALAEQVGCFDPALKCAMECDIVTRMLKAKGSARLVRWPMAALRHYPGTKTSRMRELIRDEVRQVYGRNAAGPLRKHRIREPLSKVVVLTTAIRYLNPLNARRVARKVKVRWYRPNVAEYLAGTQSASAAGRDR